VWYHGKHHGIGTRQPYNMIPTLSLSLSASDLTEEAQAQRVRIMTTYSIATVITVERAISDPAENPAPLLPPTNNAGPQSQLFVHSPLRPDSLHTRIPPVHQVCIWGSLGRFALLDPIITFTRPNVGCWKSRFHSLFENKKQTRSVW